MASGIGSGSGTSAGRDSSTGAAAAAEPEAAAFHRTEFLTEGIVMQVWASLFAFAFAYSIYRARVYAGSSCNLFANCQTSHLSPGGGGGGAGGAPSSNANPRNRPHAAHTDTQTSRSISSSSSTSSSERFAYWCRWIGVLLTVSCSIFAIDTHGVLGYVSLNVSKICGTVGAFCCFESSSLWGYFFLKYAYKLTGRMLTGSSKKDAPGGEREGTTSPKSGKSTASGGSTAVAIPKPKTKKRTRGPTVMPRGVRWILVYLPFVYMVLGVSFESLCAALNLNFFHGLALALFGTVAIGYGLLLCGVYLTLRRDIVQIIRRVVDIHAAAAALRASEHGSTAAPPSIRIQSSAGGGASTAAATAGIPPPQTLTPSPGTIAATSPNSALPNASTGGGGGGHTSGVGVPSAAGAIPSTVKLGSRDVELQVYQVALRKLFWYSFLHGSVWMAIGGVTLNSAIGVFSSPLDSPIPAPIKTYTPAVSYMLGFVLMPFLLWVSWPTPSQLATASNEAAAAAAAAEAVAPRNDAADDRVLVMGRTGLPATGAEDEAVLHTRGTVPQNGAAAGQTFGGGAAGPVAVPTAAGGESGFYGLDSSHLSREFPLGHRTPASGEESAVVEFRIRPIVKAPKDRFPPLHRPGSGQLLTAAAPLTALPPVRLLAPVMVSPSTALGAALNGESPPPQGGVGQLPSGSPGSDAPITVPGTAAGVSFQPRTTPPSRRLVSPLDHVELIAGPPVVSNLPCTVVTDPYSTTQNTNDARALAPPPPLQPAAASAALALRGLRRPLDPGTWSGAIQYTNEPQSEDGSGGAALTIVPPSMHDSRYQHVPVLVPPSASPPAPTPT